MQGDKGGKGGNNPNMGGAFEKFDGIQNFLLPSFQSHWETSQRLPNKWREQVIRWKGFMNEAGIC